MSEFDNLIKQKVSQKKYECSANSWQKFTKKAGWKSGLSALQITMIAAICTVIIAIGCFIGYKHFSSQDQALPTPQKTNPEVNIPNQGNTTIVSDTTTSESEESFSETMQETSIVNRNSEIDKKEESNNPELVTDDLNKEEGAQNNTETEKKTATKRNQYNGPIRKVTIIDLDTIKTNDF